MKRKQTTAIMKIPKINPEDVRLWKNPAVSDWMFHFAVEVKAEKLRELLLLDVDT